MAKTEIGNIEEIIKYMLDTKMSMRKAAQKFGVSLWCLHSNIKDYGGIYKNDIQKLLEDNKINSRKNYGNYRWHKNI